MASTKTQTVVHDDITLTAGAGDTTSSSVDLTDGYGATIMVEITNGGTGPTVAAQTQVQISADNTNWFKFGGALVGTTGNSEVTYFSVDIPASIEYVRTVSGSNTGQNVTLRVECDELSTI